MEQRLLFGFGVGASQDAAALFPLGFAGNLPMSCFWSCDNSGWAELHPRAWGCTCQRMSVGTQNIEHSQRFLMGALGWVTCLSLEHSWVTSDPKMPPQIPRGTGPAEHWWLP